MRLSSIIASFVALAFVFSNTQPVMAAARFFSASGTGSSCTQSAPCQIQAAIVGAGSNPEELSCADGSDNLVASSISKSLTIDCAGTTGSIRGILVSNGATVVLKSFAIWGVDAGITLLNGTVILENVHITGAGTAISAQTTSPSAIIVKNCIFDTGSAAVVLKPTAGAGSVSARFDHVTIAGNLGGGIKIDTTNAPVTVDVTDSEISGNGGNGMNAVGGAGGPAMFNISRSVIAKNGSAGVQVNGGTAAAMIDTTLLDSNATGATTVINGGHLLTYGNNRIVGSSGSGFTGPKVSLLFRSAKCRSWPIATDIAPQPNVRF